MATRVEAPEESSDPNEHPQMASLARRKPDWVPANQVHGEGIFIQFDEEALKTWEAQDGVKRVDGMLEGGHRGWRNSRHLDPNEGYPGIRYAMLHTLSHLLIRELALECGYNAASIRERIYADVSSTNPHGFMECVNGIFEIFPKKNCSNTSTMGYSGVLNVEWIALL